jgi:hypothetical protein
LRKTPHRYKLYFKATNLMNATATKLAAALRERLEVVADRESRRDRQKHLERLRHVSDRIHQLESELPLPVDPQLKHYLQRCSYDKALAFLEALPGI